MTINGLCKSWLAYKRSANTSYAKSQSLPAFLVCLALCLFACLPVFAAEDGTSFIRLKEGPPPGFEDLTEKQSTQADVFYGGEFLETVFIEYDPYTVEIENPLAAVELIPNLKNPAHIAAALSGPLPTNSGLLCNSRKNIDCGLLEPDVAGIIFDEGRYRLELFVHPSQLLVHELETQRYLPPASPGLTALHNIRMSAAGSGGEHQLSISNESYVAREHARVRARYGFSDGSPALYELSWQRDAKDLEYEAGSFRSLGRGLGFVSDVDLLGFRVATSTKTRTDLDTALATPILLFLTHRSRVDVYRGEELLDTQYYAAGNQQLKTSELPDGAYEINLRIEDVTGNTRTVTQFFVRSSQMPPMGEPQYYAEAGSLLQNQFSTVPQLSGGIWARAGSSHRVAEDMSWDNEVLYADEKAVVQSGAFFLRPSWNLYAGAMATSTADFGLAFRGALQTGSVYASVDFRHVMEGQSDVQLGDFSLTRGGYTQGSATVGFPVAKGQLFLRARINDRVGLQERDLGFSYQGALFSGAGISADLIVDGGFGADRKWVRAGVNFRWQGNGRSTTVNPRVRMSQDNRSGGGDGFATSPELLARWNNQSDLFGFEDINQTAFLSHGEDRSAIGARFVPGRRQQSDAEFGYERRSGSGGDLFYAANNRFSIANSQGKTTMGSGAGGAGAVIVKIDGNIDERFEVLVGNRVVGYSEVGNANVVSLRPYETYDVRIRPSSDRIIGYDQNTRQVTLYPGNVKTLSFSARELIVIIAQAIYPDGSPVAKAVFENVEDYGATDELGWFQIELSHDDPLILRTRSGDRCSLVLPDDYEVSEGLAVLDPLVCRIPKSKNYEGGYE